MKRTNQLLHNSPGSAEELLQHIVYHEAGHVVAIYLRNHQQKLPPVFFQIMINRQQQKHHSHFAQVLGGRLIDNLPVAEIENNQLGSLEEQQSLQKAYEADVINLLIGPLAEAKYVALRDDEIFNLHLINIVALKNYGGHSDIEQASRYLEYFIPSAAERELKISALYTKAFRFIEEPNNWKCIQLFASYLLQSEQTIISCEQASDILEHFLVK